MLVTTSDQATLDTAGIHKGMPAAGCNAAEPTPVSAFPFNPAWADQPALAVQRLAKLPSQPELMSEAFRDTRFPHQPTRRTLTDTLKVFAACGHLNANQARWMNEHKAYPNRIWSAIEGLAPALVADPNQQIQAALTQSLTDLYPIRAMTRFVTAWYKHLPECVEPSLIAALQQVIRACSDAPQAQATPTFDWETIEVCMTKTLRHIAAALNARMATAKPTNGQSAINLSLCFAEHMTVDSPLIVGADHMEGFELSLNPDVDCAEGTWDAVKLALRLMQTHLMPLTLSSDILEINCMMDEEAEDDLNLIKGYLDAAGKDHDDLAAVDEAMDALRSDLYFLGDSDHYEAADEKRRDRAATNDRWQIEGTLTVERLSRSLEHLPAPDSDQERQLHDWLHTTATALANHTESWADVLENQLSCDTSPRLLDEFTPVWLEDEGSVYEALDDRHQFMMQGGEECEPLSLAWDADPAAILSWCDRMRSGATLLINLFRLTENRHK